MELVWFCCGAGNPEGTRRDVAILIAG
jgi:hypothetical protein